MILFSVTMETKLFGQQPTGQHLIINTYGMATLHHHDREMARSDRRMADGIASHCFNYQVRVNATGAFDIQRKTMMPVVPLHVAFEDATGILFHLEVTSDAIVIPPRYRISRDELVQSFTLRPNPVFPGGFRIRLLASKVIRRIDLRYSNHSWVSVFVAARQILGVRLQGEEAAEVLYEICTRVSTYGSNEDNNDYGLRPAPRARSRQPSPSQPNARYSGMANPMPAPVFRSRQSSPARENVRPNDIPKLEPYVPETPSLTEAMSLPMQIQERSQSAMSTTSMESPTEVRATGTVPKTEKKGEGDQIAGPSGAQIAITPKGKSTKKIKEIAKLLASEIVHQWASICDDSDEEEGEIKEE